MNYLNKEELYSNQLVSGVFIIKKCEFTVNLIKKWQQIMINDNYNMLDDTKSIPQFPGFKDHRHDQSIFSILRKQLGCIIIDDETYFDGTWDNYKQYPIHATRKRN